MVKIWLIPAIADNEQACKGHKIFKSIPLFKEKHQHRKQEWLEESAAEKDPTLNPNLFCWNNRPGRDWSPAFDICTPVIVK